MWDGKNSALINSIWQTILDEPHEDVHRFALVDALEELDMPYWAEFVEFVRLRLSISRKELTGGPAKKARRRADSILRGHYRKWLNNAVLNIAPKEGDMLSRATVNDGHLFYERYAHALDGRNKFHVGFSRGLLEMVGLVKTDIHVLPDIVKVYPITNVKIFGWVHLGDGNGKWGWYCGDNSVNASQHTLPKFIYEKLQGGKMSYDKVDNFRWYDKSFDAMLAMKNAVMEWAKL